MFVLQVMRNQERTRERERELEQTSTSGKDAMVSVVRPMLALSRLHVGSVLAENFGRFHVCVWTIVGRSREQEEKERYPRI